MKKLLFTIAFSIQLVAMLFAQPAASEELSAYNSKRTLGRSELKINVIRDFSRRFPDVANPFWSSGSNDNFRARFTRAGIKYMVDYDQKGRWAETILVYDESQLSRDLRKVVKSIYIDFDIVKVIEVKIGKSHVHIVKLENESSLLTLHIMNGEITEMENYRKG